MGHVGRFAPADGYPHSRGTRVLCRTRRGVETGEVLAADDHPGSELDGQLLRRITVEDDLLLARLGRHRDRAHEACLALLKERQIPAVLVDVEHLFDGESLYFYFLGKTTSELEAITQELADLYETKVEFRKFAESLETGCGPGCGTPEAENGCSQGGCQTCVIAAACQSR